MDQATGDAIAAQLGLTPQRVQALRSLPFEKALLDLDVLKKEARSLYRRLVFQRHPDRNPGDPDAVQKLTDLSEVMKTIDGLKLQRAAPPPVMRVQYVYVNQPVYQPPSRSPSYSTSANTSTTSTYYAGRVAFVKPV